LKTIFFIAIGLLFTNSALSQTTDTSFYYYKYVFGEYNKVKTIDEADFVRVILPADSGQQQYTVKEYYKNGKLKFVGKSDPVNPEYDNLVLHGACISFYPDGKKGQLPIIIMAIRTGSLLNIIQMESFIAVLNTKELISKTITVT
jgi:hypothetical protein